jgi:hypothetical protein
MGHLTVLAGDAEVALAAARDWKARLPAGK